ncbi:MAG: ATP-grasp domain-containing protein [Deltaproteobacteria bacterium]|nr:ATP-grasp domain-containing protein [Deltaproteobacteria bacterium]
MRKERAIWIFAGGPMQEIAARKVLERGYKLLVTDRNPGCVCAAHADEVVPLDTFDIKGNLKVAPRLGKKYRIEAVLAPAADCHESVAFVGKALELPAISPGVSRRCRYKNLTRDVLSRAGIPQPRFRSVRTVSEAREFLREIGGRGVVKATDNSGSRGFTAVREPGDLTEAALEKAVSAGTTGLAVVEEMLSPVEDEIAEQSVETLWHNGRMYWLNWVDRLFRKDFLFFESLKTGIYENVSWGVELGHINPAVHPYGTKAAVADLVRRAGLAVGMHKEKGGHIFKADIMLTRNGPYVLEVTPRLSGGWDSSASTPARGADFAGGAIALALGERLTLDAWHRYYQYKDPERFVSVLARIEEGATDCIGRMFSIGSDYERENAIRNTLANLLEERYVVPMVQPETTEDAHGRRQGRRLGL